MKMIRLAVPVFALLLTSHHLLAQSYEQQLARWYQQREEELKAENGWLNLVGLLWLQEGDNSFGSDKANALVFPSAMPARAGSLVRKGKQVYLKATAPVTVNGVLRSEALVFDADSARNPVMQCGDLRWNIIRREDKLGIRLRDLKSPALAAFRGIDHFPLNRAMVIEARYEPHAVPTSIPVTNVLGQTTRQFSPGMVYFSMAGRSCQLIALEEEGQLFFVFGDPTNETDTYAAGRFLKADMPKGPGTVVLDFNKAYNPPCAFTPFATCPLPPTQNLLEEPVKAGEKNYKAAH